MNKIHNNKNKNAGNGWHRAFLWLRRKSLTLIMIVITALVLVPCAADAAVPVIENYTFHANSAGSPDTDITLSKPSGWAVGDLFLCFVSSDHDGGPEWDLHPTPQLWTREVNVGTSSSDAVTGIYWRIADGTEPSTVTFTQNANDDLMGFWIVISGVDTSDPIHNTSGVGEEDSGSGSTFDITGHNTTVDDVLALWFMSFDGADGDTWVITAAGWTDFIYGETAGGDNTDISGGWGRRNMASQGATGTVNVNPSATDGASKAQVSINPSAGATTTIGDGTSPADNSVLPSSTNNAVDAFTLSTDTEPETVTALEVTFTGTDVADVATDGVKIWDDSTGDTPNEWDSNDTEKGYASFSGTTADVTVSISVDSTPTQYLVTYNIAADATVSNTLQGAITDATVTNSLANNDATDATLTVSCSSCVNLLGSWGTGLSHTAPAGSDRVLIFIAGLQVWGYEPHLTSVTYGTQPLTRISDARIHQDNHGHVEVWMLDEAGIAAASNSTFVPTWDDSTSDLAYSHAFFSNVNQTNSIYKQATDITGSITPNPVTTVGLDTNDSDMVVVAAAAFWQSGTYAPQNGFTEGNDQQVGSITLGTAYKSASGATETPSMTHSDASGSLYGQVIAGIVLRYVSSPVYTEGRLLGWWRTGLTHPAEAGSDRVLIFVAAAENWGEIPILNSLTYGGQSLSRVDSVSAEIETGSSNDGTLEVWILKEAGIAAASGDTFSPTWNTSLDKEIYSSAFFSGVDQTTSTGVPVTNSGASPAPNPITTAGLSTANGDMVITAAASGWGADKYTPGNGFIEGNDHNDHDKLLLGTAYKEATGATETPSMTNSDYTSDLTGQLIFGVVINSLYSCPVGSVCWDGGGSTNNWSEGANWTGNAVPGSTADVVFNGLSTKDATFNAADTIGSLTLDSDYSDALTLAATLTNDGTFIMNAGTLNMGSATINQNDDWTYTAGTVDAGTSNVIMASAEFDVNSGAMAFNDVTLSLGGNSLAVTGTMDVDGDLTINSVDCISTGTIAVSGNVTTTDTAVCQSGAAKILIDGSGPQILSASGGAGGLPAIEIDNSGTLTIQDTIHMDDNWVFTGGTVDAGTSTVIFDGADLSITTGSMAFNNVTVNFGGAGNTITLTDTLDIDGNLTLTDVGDGFSGAGGIEVAGNLTSTDVGCCHDSNAITLDGANPQTVDIATGNLPSGLFTINKTNPTDTVTLLSAMALAASQDLTITRGVLAIGAYDLTVDALTVDTNGDITCAGGMITANSETGAGLPYSCGTVAIQFRNQSSDATSGSALSLQVNKPTGCVDGDLLIAVMNADEVTTTLSAPDGTWTPFALAGTETNIVTRAWWKRAYGEGATYTFGSTESSPLSLIIGCFYNDAGVGVWAIEDDSCVTDQYTNPLSTASVTGVDNCLMIAAWGGDGGDDTVTLAPDNMTIIGSQQIAFPTSGSHAVAYYEMKHAGAVTKSCTFSGTDDTTAMAGIFSWASPTTTIGEGTSPANKDVAPDSTNNAVNAFTLVTDTEPETVTALEVTFTGTAVADVATDGVKIYDDSTGGTPNEWDDTDTLKGTASFSGDTASVTVSISVDSTPTQYLVTYDIATGATETNTLQGAITDATVTNTLVNNDAADATLTIFSSTTIGDGTSPPNKDVAASGTNYAVDAFTLVTNTGADTVTALTVTFTGTDVTDVASSGVKIYDDSTGGTPNEWDAGDTLKGTASFSGATASVTVSISVDTSATQYLVTYDIAAGATVPNTLQGEITAATVTNTLVNNDTTDATLTISDDCDFSYRKPITIDNTQVFGTSDHLNFPVLVSLSGNWLKTTTADSSNGRVENANGYDIIFKNSTGTTQLDHEIESYDGSASGGTLVAWVRIPTLDYDDDTVIYMYYGNSCISSSLENVTGVWNDNYMGVWHLSQTPDTDGGTEEILDSNNSNDGDSNNMDAGDQIAGRIDGALNFDGTDEYVEILHHSSIDFADDDFSYSFWLKALEADFIHNDRILNKGTSSVVGCGNGNRYEFSWADSILLSAVIDQEGVGKSQAQRTSTPYLDNTWHYVTFTRKASTNEIKLYKDGDQDGVTETDSSGDISNGCPLLLGTASDVAEYAKMVLDELRISDKVRSADWIKTSFYNQKVNSIFYIEGDEEVLNCSFIYRKPITLESDEVIGSSDLSNFPVLINLSGDWLKTTTADLTNGRIENASGYDIIFKDSGGTHLDHEIEKYDGSASGGTLIAWVRIPTLSYNTDTVIYMYYGNGCISSSQENITGVWNSNYKGVWHLDESPVDQGTHADSTSNGNTGMWNDTNSLGNTNATGRIDGADDFDGTDDSIDVSYNASLDITSELTLSAWIKSTTDSRYILARQADDGGAPTYESAPGVAHFEDDGDTTVTKSYTVPAGQNRILIVMAIADDDSSCDPVAPTGVTYGGKPLDKLDEATYSTDNHVSLWYLLETDIVAAVGTNVIATWSCDGGDMGLLAYSYAGVDQDIPFGTPNHNQGNGTTATVTIESAVGELVIEGTSYNMDSSGAEPAVGEVNQTLRMHEEGPEADADGTWVRMLASDKLADGTSVAMSWDTADGNQWAIVGASLKPVAGGGDMPCALNTKNGGEFLVNNSSTEYSVSASGNINDDQWYHITATYDGSTMSLYKDGVFSLSDTNFSGDLPTNSNDLLIGDDYGSSSSGYINGILDEVRILNTALSADWIQTEHNNQKAGSTFTVEGNEDVLGCSYSFYKPITIESDEVFGTSISTNTWQVPANDRDAWDDGGEGNLTDSHFGDSTWGDVGGHQFAVTIPQGATIISAKLQVYSSSHGGATGAYTAQINIEDVDSAAAFDGTATDVSGRSYYATSVNWSIDAAGLDTDTWSDSPDIKDLIQYVVNKAGWSSGNYLNIAIWGTTSNGGSYENIRDYTDDPDLAVKLEVTYQDSSSPHQNFPFLVNISSDNDLRTTTNNGDVENINGYDIIFKDSYGTQLDHEIEQYEPTSGKFVAWVRIPTLSLSVDTVIYMYYGSSCIGTSQENITGVWNSNYKAVWHLDETPVDQGTHSDSTSNGNTGTWNDTNDQGNTNATGRIDGADTFDTIDDYISIVTHSSLDISTDFTVTAWFYKNTSGAEDLIYSSGTTNTQYWTIRSEPVSDKIEFNVDGTGGWESSTAIGTGAWHYMAVVKDGDSGTNLSFYVDGGPDGTATVGSVPASTGQTRAIGYRPEGNDFYWGGTLDEIRISDTNRSAGWIKTCYYNQKENSTFYIVDPEENYAPTAVDLISFTATGQSSTILVEWETAQEIDNLGFNLYRSSEPYGSYAKLNSSLIPGLISSVSGQQYTFIDGDVTRDVLYYYMLEDLDLSGTRTMHGPVCVDWDGDGIPDDYDEDPDDDDSDDDTDEDPEVKIPELRFEEVDFGPEGWTPSSSYASWVKLSNFRARQGDEGIALEWETSFEVDNFGFHVYREVGGKFYRITPDLVPGSVFKAGAGRELSAGQSYAYWDGLSEGTGGELYWLDCVELNGGRASFGPIKPEIYGQPVSKRQKVRFRSITRHQVSRARALGKARELREELSTKPIRTQSSTATFRTIDPEMPSEPRLPPTEEQWALAAQPGVKIYIKEDGWYRIGEPELVAAGLSPAVDPRYLQLYADGEEKSMMVTGSDDGRFDPLDAVEFYGTGLDKQFSDARVYWLVVGSRPGRRVDTPFIDIRLDLGKRMRIPRGLRGRGAPLSFPFYMQLKERTFYFAALKNGEGDNFFGSLISTEPVDQLLTVAHPDLSSPEDAVLEVLLQGATDSTHQVKILLNYVEVGELSVIGQKPEEVEIQVPHDLLLEGDNIVTLTAQGGATDVSLMDKIRLTYWRKYTADEDFLQFKTSGGEWLSVGGFSSSEIQVVDITDPMRMINIRGKVMTQDSGYAITVKVPGAGERKLLAFTEDKIKQPAGIEANLASSWHEISQGADVIIISHRDLLESVGFLKQLREQQGWSVVLVDVEDLYDEFNFGAKSPWAMKDFLAQAYAYWNPQPRFVLLVGDASYDPRNYLGFGEFDLVPTKFVDTGHLTTASDDWFVDFDDDGLPEMAVGRLPVESAEEAETVVSKIIAFESVAGLMNEALLVADINDFIDFEGASADVAEELLAGSMGVTEILRGRSATARSDLFNLLNQGQLLVNYIGHGSTQIWNGNLLTSSDAWNLTNSPNLPFLVSMTCLNGFFQDPYSESLAETFLKAARGGAVAVWTSSGLTLPTEQNVMNLELIRLLFNGQGLTIGEAVMRAKRATTNSDIRRTWILFGDPTLRLR